ncbi:MAG TPA: hypothetical protein VJT81_00845 [Burkholderiales bacterium]|nr:hypothetical protein [Burkholderiales bacterium]
MTARITALSAEAAHIREEQAHGKIEAEQDALVGIAADIEEIEGERALLVAAKEATVEAAARGANEHERTGSFGYQVLSGPDDRVTMIVDENGDYLPISAVYTYEVVDENPPLPMWGRKGKVGH